MSKPASPRKGRLHLVLSERVEMRLEALRVRIDADSRTEVIRRALYVYDALTCLREGESLVLERSDGTQERIRFL